jgi:hypothetical protein
MLTLPLTFQRLQSIARRHSQIIKALGAVQETKLPQRHGLNIGRKPSTSLASPDRRCLGITKSDDHCE